MKRAAIYTLGCRLNRAETSILAERLSRAGYTLVPFGEAADLGVINTCTVTAEADAKSRKAIRAFVRKNPEASVAVIGCYAQLAVETIGGIAGVDLIVGTQDKLDLLKYLPEQKRPVPRVVHGDIARADFTIPAPGGATQHTRVHLKVQDGCDCRCSYCVVPFARGPARSRDLEDLLDEARKHIGLGTKEIVVTGVNVGNYDFNGYGLLHVLDSLNEIEGIRRIRLSSIELGPVFDGLLERMNSDAHALVPFLHIPLQSASNRVLAAMKRPYTAEDFGAFARKVATEVADVCIGADILVGFPGETEDEFAETCRFLEESPVTHTHVFKYSERPGTAAVEIAGKIDPKTLNRRSLEVRQIGTRKRQAFHARHVGRTLDVLFEKQEDGRWYGYTGNYIRVAACSDNELENCIAAVTLDEDFGDFMTGHIVEEGAIAE